MFLSKMLCFKGFFMILAAVSMVIVHILSKTYVEEFRMSVSLSEGKYSVSKASAVLDLARSLTELKIISRRYKTNQIGLLDGRAKFLLKLPPNMGGEFTPKSDEQITCVSDKTAKVLVLFDSPYKDITKRMLIRDSWKKQMRKIGRNHSIYWKFVFIVSQPDPSWRENQLFRIEVKSRRDMLVIERPEQSNQASTKLYSAFRWVLNSCSFEFLLFADTNFMVDVGALYQFVHSKNLHSSKNLFIGHKVSGKVNITYNPMNQSKPHTKNLRLLQDAVFLVSKDVLENTLDPMRWLSSFGKVHDPLKMLALALDGAKVQIATHEQFIGETTSDCKLDPEKSFLVRMPNEKCYSKLLVK